MLTRYPAFILVLTVYIFTSYLTSALLAQGKISPLLLEEMAEARASGEPVRALIMMQDRLHIEALDQSLYSTNVIPSERATTVITALKEHALVSQRDLIDWLSTKPEQHLPDYTTFWAANIVAVWALPEVIDEVSMRADVGYIHRDAELKLITPVTNETASSEPDGVEPGLHAINAHKMWEAGYTGEGTIVMNMDTGVNGSHIAFASRWLGNRVPSSQAWFDPWHETDFPVDSDILFSHGTHTMGTMTGLDETTNDTIGVAFGAEWMASNSLVGELPHTSRSLASFEWAMDSDDDPETTTEMPIAINCSWWDPDLDEFNDCDPAFNPYIDLFAALEAAGIAIVFACGNSGPYPTTITRPSNTNLDEVNLFTVGATDPHDPNYQIAWFSSRGPVPEWCETGDLSLDTKPEVSAPGLNVRSSQFNGYGLLSGTSMASPHVCGAIALLKEAHPLLTGKQLKWALYESALDLGEPGEDNTYGTGQIDVWAAHLHLSDPNEPNRPREFLAYSDYLSPASVALSWTDPETYVSGEPLTSFSIELFRNGEFLSSIASGTESYTDTDVVDGYYYEYDIYAKDDQDSLSYPVQDDAYAGGSPTPAPPSNLSCTSTPTEVILIWEDPATQSDGTPLDDLDHINIYRDSVLIATRPPGAESFSDAPDPGVLHLYYITAVDSENESNESISSNAVECLAGNTVDYLVWVGEDAFGASAASGDSIFEALAANNRSVAISNDLLEFGNDLTVFKAIFVVLGIYPNNHFIAGLDDEGPILESYLQNGGGLYIEGGDCFNYDPEEGGYEIRPWFGLGDGGDGIPDVNGIEGLNDFSSFLFNYAGENNFMDDLLPEGSIEIFQNDHLFPDVTGVYFDGFGSGRSIGMVPSFGGLVDNAAQARPGIREHESKPGSVATHQTRVKGKDVRAGATSATKTRVHIPTHPTTINPSSHQLISMIDGHLRIEANTKDELMLAYLQLLTPPGPAVTASLLVPDQSGNGKVEYVATFINSTDSTNAIDVWSTIEGPQGFSDDVFLEEVQIAPFGNGVISDTYTIPGNTPHGDYELRIFSGHYPDVVIDSDSALYVKEITGITANDTLQLSGIPTEFKLRQNRPNPFNPSTLISLELPSQSDVRLTVYDISGRKVAELIRTSLNAGYHDIMWDGRNASGVQVSSGVYIYRVDASPINGVDVQDNQERKRFVQTRKMLLVR